MAGTRDLDRSVTDVINDFSVSAVSTSNVWGGEEGLECEGRRGVVRSARKTSLSCYIENHIFSSRSENKRRRYE